MGKLLLVNSNADVGSTGKICMSIADAYIERGWDVKIAYGRNKKDPTANEPLFYHITAPLNLEWHGLCTRLFDRHGFASKRATRNFIKWADSYDPDVLWLHNIHGYYINVELLFDWIKSRPNMMVKWTLHDTWAFTGHCPHFAEIGCNQWQSGCKKCPQKKEYPASLWLDNCKDNFKRKKKSFTGVNDLSIITPSIWLSSLVKQSYLGEYSVNVINNSIDRSVFKPLSSDFRAKNGLEDKFVLLGVAYGWGRKKGLDVFIELSQRLDERFRIVLVGTDEAAEKQLPDSIIAIRRTYDQRELAEIYSSADLFVNPTREDTFPTVNMEALSCGTPIVTFDTGGSPEIIDETCGCVVPIDDVDGMEREILRICEERPFSTEVCEKRAELFDSFKICNNYYEIANVGKEK